MKLSTLENDEGLSQWFQRLIDSNPSKIVIFQPDTTPAKSETEVHFWFPCNEKRHDSDCGFFSLVISLATDDEIFGDIEALRREYNLTEAQVAIILQEQAQWAFGVPVHSRYFNNFDVMRMVSDWIAEWVAGLADVPLVLVDLLEHQRRWAKYEEFHPHQEAADLFFAARRDVNSDYQAPDGKVYPRDEFMEVLRKAIDKAKEQTSEENEDEQ